MLYKELITKKRRIQLRESYIIINVKQRASQQHKYLKELENVIFIDGEYHKYCGVIKIIINNFMTYWTEKLERYVKAVDDALLGTINKKKAFALIDETANIQAAKQENYLSVFGVPENAKEQKILDEISELYEARLQDLQEMKNNINRLVQKEQVTEIIHHQLKLSITNINDTFKLLKAAMATHLADHSDRIRICYEEILLRMSNDLKKWKEKRVGEMKSLMVDLYEANKDRLVASRQHTYRDLDTAEVDYEISQIREKINRHQEDQPFAHLEHEVAYWEKKTKQYQHIDETIKKLKTELQNVTKLLEKYNQMSTTERPGSKKTCWINIGENYKRRKELCENSLLNASKAILTFFALKGQDRILYKDKIGKYAIDDYGHQVYYFDHGETISHTTCGGKLVPVVMTDKYYFDEAGRYILSDTGEKVYQIVSCCSTYNLNQDNLLMKTTKDCGHSEAPNLKCGLRIKKPNDLELVPAAEPVNIKQTLDPAVVKYLWDSVAYILPDALYDTGMKQPRNPIYYLANRLIYHKYHKNNRPQLEKKYKEAEKFRADIHKKRKDETIAEAKAYRTRQVQPRKPEESDNTENIQIQAARAAVKNLIQQLSYD